MVALLAAFLLGWPSPALAPLGAERSLAYQAGVGACSAAPLIGAFVLLDRHPASWISGLRREAARLALGLFRGATVMHLVLVSVAAGIGEEMLFRGLLIGSLTRGTDVDVPTALVVSSVVFGLAHPISRNYVLVAGAVGIYLGAVYLWSGGLVAPILAHSLYDFFALWHLLRGVDAATPDAGGLLDEAETTSGESSEHE